jgi:hypothetical protein
MLMCCIRCSIYILWPLRTFRRKNPAKNARFFKTICTFPRRIVYFNDSKVSVKLINSFSLVFICFRFVSVRSFIQDSYSGDFLKPFNYYTLVFKECAITVRRIPLSCTFLLYPKHPPT